MAAPAAMFVEQVLARVPLPRGSGAVAAPIANEATNGFSQAQVSNVLLVLRSRNMLSVSRMGRILLAVGSAALAAVAFAADEPTSQPAGAPAAAAIDPSPVIDLRAEEALKKMSKTLADAKAFRFVAEQEFDVLDATGMKLQHDRRLEVRVARPNRVMAVARGRGWDRSYTYDGAQVTLMDRHAKTYSQVPFSGSVGQMLETMSAKYGLSVPTGDFLFDDVFAALTDGMRIGRYVGKATIGGKECDHVAFSGDDVDWQLWIARDGPALPVKFVVVRKADAGAPQFQARFTEWKLSDSLDDADLKLDLPTDFEKLELASVDS